MAAITHSILRSALGLGLFAVFTAGTIAVTQVVTEERIEQQVRKAEAAALFEIIPEAMHDNDLLSSTLTLSPDPLLGIREPAQAWLAKQDDEPVGVILPVVAHNGYSGDIRLLVGVAPDGEVLGVRVTSHRETPGLGDKIELKKSDWITTFEGKSLGDPEPDNWAVKKDGGAFDQFTGATITPRAVVGAVRDALRYFEDNRQALLAGNTPDTAPRQGD
ncbi:MAG: electron transport complex subunit RsxG [Marinobacter sp.]|uniref:electron transport complex subunit RsxG n=1 Tax=Marinobacter sp. TaxID=50741 RepID=UPI00299ECFA6|nr:electron transport complex subunit RsxG [Marinobacter sp.]MDX1635332.1 electron transport complex subunit RsxG [Marinobacter sp.]